MSHIQARLATGNHSAIKDRITRHIAAGVVAAKSFPPRLLACLLVIASLTAVAVSLAGKASAEEPNQPAAVAAELSANDAVNNDDTSINAVKGDVNDAANDNSWFSALQSFFGSLFGSKTIVPKNAANALTAPAASAAPALMVSTTMTAFDFDGDHKADMAVFNPTTGIWSVLQSSTGTVVQQSWGQNGDQPAPADYDGDGKTDYAYFRPSTGVWSILKSNGTGTAGQQWGQNGDLAVPADYDGDGKADISVFRPSTGGWYIIKSLSGSMYGMQFGISEDIPVPGDYDLDGKADISVFRPSTGGWYASASSNGAFLAQSWGATGDFPVPADYDGDNKTDYAVWRPSTGYWYVINSSNGSMLYAQFGSDANAQRDIPVPADYDGDNKADIAVWRRATNNWHIWNSSNGTYTGAQLGQSGDAPVSSAPNLRPVAEAGGPYAAQTGTAVTLNGSQSSDADGTVISYSWNFGDGTTGLGRTPAHAYSAARTYTVTLTVTDNRGAPSATADTAQVTVNQAVPPRLSKEYIYGGSRMIAIEEAATP